MTNVQPEDPNVNDVWFNTETGEFKKYDGEKWVKVVCDVCGTAEDLRRAPIMTGIPFSAREVVAVCRECIRTWYDSGEVMREGILRERLRKVEGK